MASAGGTFLSIPIEPLRWGLVGLGKFATEALAPAIRRSDWAEIAACASREVADARQFAERFSVAKVFDTFEELVHDPEVDAVYVATPNALHLPVVLAAAAAGKPALCEKPLALGLEDGAAMVAACRNAGVLLRVGLHLRFDRTLLRVAEILHEGAIGAVRALSIERTAPLDERVPWRADPLSGGSILYDVGVHLLDLVPRLAGGEIVSVSALGSPAPSSGFAADTITMLLRLDNGAQATACVSREAPFAGNDLVVIGTEGMLRTGPLRWVDEHWVSVTTAAGSHTELIPAADLYRLQLDAFAADLADGGCRLATGEDGLRHIALADAVQRALR
jgi:1,5-anhydro-D-fructose reductase (1,5-anhydro-D-mannitol-forming)